MLCHQCFFHPRPTLIILHLSPKLQVYKAGQAVLSYRKAVDGKAAPDSVPEDTNLKLRLELTNPVSSLEACTVASVTVPTSDSAAIPTPTKPVTDPLVADYANTLFGLACSSECATTSFSGEFYFTNVATTGTAKVQVTWTCKRADRSEYTVGPQDATASIVVS